MFVQNVQNIAADVTQFLLNLAAVGADHFQFVVGALWLLLLLDGGDNTPRRPPRADHILVRHREQIALLDGQLHI